jgi:hypothetical protein
MYHMLLYPRHEYTIHRNLRVFLKYPVLMKSTIYEAPRCIIFSIFLFCTDFLPFFFCVMRNKRKQSYEITTVFVEHCVRLATETLPLRFTFCRRPTVCVPCGKISRRICWTLTHDAIYTDVVQTHSTHQHLKMCLVRLFVSCQHLFSHVTAVRSACAVED